ncbi:MAG TPA: hypothetical protein VFC51_16495 [Chloroflexota bacterium]|nr:hypothetical protein [Chloroflexota bacterium]
MVEQLIRAAEAPISLSIGVARKSVELTGRLAGWALTEIVGVLSPDRQNGSFASTDTPPAPTSSWEPGAEESAAVTEEEAEVAGDPAEEETLPVDALTDEEPSLPSDAVTEDEEPTLPSDAVTEDEEPTLPRAAVTEEEPVVGGENGAIADDEPGTETSVRARDPHSALNNPVAEADLTEWPDPYDHREDPRDPGEEMVFGGEGGHTQTGATSTSEPHPSQDPEVEAWEGPKRDKIDQ